MRVLLDTHALLWWLTDDPSLPGPLREVIADPGNEIIVSAASAWEIATKHRLGKLPEASEVAGRPTTPQRPLARWRVGCVR